MLQLFEALEDNCTQSQRELSRNLNVSLGSVNQLLKEVISKGYLKISLKNRGKAKYSITSRGRNKKSKLLLEYISNSIRHYDYLKSRMCRLIEHMVGTDRKKVILCGANGLTEIVCIILQEYNLNLVGIIDDQQVGKKVAGKTVRESSFLQDNLFDALIITMMDIPEQLFDVIINSGVSPKKIHSIRTAFDKHTPIEKDGLTSI